MEIPGGDWLFFGGMTALFGFLTFSYGRRLARVVRALRGGARAEGTCVRVETEPYNRSDAERHFFAFRTPEGREVEFEDLSGRSVKAGTPVTVTYDPADPARTATVAGRGNWGPVAQYALVVAGCAFATAGFLAVLLFTVVL
ncbi:DUF3592 domain-containing protein [Streptomyces sp. NPDC001941]|uniref:DUF3592 domain-containing protein n=1 Tax=Streptomyces sp. NPDC001941 TaxID=3154659 RepID=UPI00332B174E